jgi:hypothetical protein
MPDLTEEKYDTLDEEWIENLPQPGPKGTGFVRRKAASVAKKTERALQLTAHSSQLTAHSSQLTAHSSQLTAHIISYVKQRMSST